MTDDAKVEDTMAAGAAGAGTGIARGRMIGGYRIEREIGHGGMGAVYAAVQPDIGKKVAVKVLKSQWATTPGFAERFLAEAQAVNRIGNEYIVDIFAFGYLPEGPPYFVMEFLEGETLAARLAHATVAPADLKVWLQQLCQALAAAHGAGIVHRDLKPENIWLVADAAGRPRVKLLDFGIAKQLEAANQLTAVGEMIGTPAYMAPEQAMGQAIDARVDIYAMGVILYEIATGTVPFKGGTGQQLALKHAVEQPTAPSRIRRISPSLETLILSCLEKDPAKRPATIEDLWRRLEATFADLRHVPPPTETPPGQRVTHPTPVSVVTPGPSPSNRTISPVPDLPPAPARPRSKGGSIVVASLVLLSGGGIFYFFLRSPSSEGPAAPPIPLVSPTPKPVAESAPIKVPPETIPSDNTPPLKMAAHDVPSAAGGAGGTAPQPAPRDRRRDKAKPAPRNQPGDQPPEEFL